IGPTGVADPVQLDLGMSRTFAADNLNADRLRDDAAIGRLRLAALDPGDHIGSVTIEIVCGAAKDRAGIEPGPYGRRRWRRRWRWVLLLDQQAGSIQRHALCQQRRSQAARGHKTHNEPPNP